MAWESGPPLAAISSERRLVSSEASSPPRLLADCYGAAFVGFFSPLLLVNGAISVLKGSAVAIADTSFSALLGLVVAVSLPNLVRAARAFSFS